MRTKPPSDGTKTSASITRKAAIPWSGWDWGRTFSRSRARLREGRCPYRSLTYFRFQTVLGSTSLRRRQQIESGIFPTLSGGFAVTRPKPDGKAAAFNPQPTSSLFL